jgi:hypothetical protein
MNVHLNRLNFIKEIFSHTTLAGYVLEFGVGSGQSLRVLAKNTTQRVIGFDSFEGMPEPWKFNDRETYEQGDMKFDPPMPKPANVIYVKGWFSDTIPVWKQTYKADVAFLHIDSDLYSSCKTVLTELNDQIVPGTIILFDEMFNFQYWKDGEYKAFNEWVEKYDRELELIDKHYTQAAYKVIK